MDIPFLKIKNIIKKFGSRTVLNDISLDIYKGEIISLLGVNGAGKTTLSSIIATLFPPTTGDIEFEGKSIYSDIVSYRFNIGFCQQKPNLTTALTLEQNLRLAGSYYNMPQNLIERRLGELAEQFDLHPYLKEDASILSGGFRQRFMIARSLMHNPKLLLLDEPTVALDPHIRRQLWSKIKELKSTGVTVILTTHYLDEAEQLSDRVCVLNKGIIRLIDTPDKLKIDFKMKNLEDVFVALMEENPLSQEGNS